MRPGDSFFLVRLPHKFEWLARLPQLSIKTTDIFSQTEIDPCQRNNGGCHINATCFSTAPGQVRDNYLVRRLQFKTELCHCVQ